jgi:molybdopterin-guanine dinucleotide biosynthesis protein A
MTSGAAGMVLAGGRSERMGEPKASLPWHGSTLLRRVAGVVARGVDGPLVVVRAPGQPLPSLPRGVVVVDDREEGRGPLAGLAAGLAALTARAERVFVAATDAPLLHPAVVRHVLDALDADADADIALPVADGHRHHLAAAYRVALLATVEELLAQHPSPGLGTLVARSRVRRLDAALLRADPAIAELDPGLDSLRNLNTTGDYASALALPEPLVAVLAGPGMPPRAVRAATLGRLAAALDHPLKDAAVTVNGRPVEPDGELPLVAGDTVALGEAALAPATQLTPSSSSNRRLRSIPPA